MAAPRIELIGFAIRPRTSFGVIVAGVLDTATRPRQLVVPALASTGDFFAGRRVLHLNLLSPILGFQFWSVSGHYLFVPAWLIQQVGRSFKQWCTTLFFVVVADIPDATTRIGQLKIATTTTAGYYNDDRIIHTSIPHSALGAVAILSFSLFHPIDKENPKKT